MSHLSRWLGPAVVAGIVTFSTALVFADQPTTQPANQQDLQSQVNALRAEVVDLKTQQMQYQAQNQADLTAITQDVIADADRHSQFLDGGMGLTAGYANHRFFIGSEDGNFTLRPWIHIQVRDSTSYQQSPYDTQNGLEIRRARLGFDGNLFGQNLTYFINWATNRANSTQTLTVKNTAGATVGTTTEDYPVGGLPTLEEAWMKYHFEESPWYIHVGQMHDPLDHENIVGSKYRQPEASLQGDIFGNTDTFTQAATVIFDPKQELRWEAGINHGIRGANVSFLDPTGDPPNPGFQAYNGGVAGRVEYKLMGNWHDYDQMTALGDKKDLLVFGAGADYSYGRGAYYTLSETADVTYSGPEGWFNYLAFFGRYTSDNIGIPATSNPGFVLASTTSRDLGHDTWEPSVDEQLGYLIDQKWEPFVRYEYMHLQGTPVGSNNNVTDISLGVNWYIYGQNLKFTGMVTYLPTGIPISDSSADIPASNKKPETVFISQIQLLL